MNQVDRQIAPLYHPAHESSWRALIAVEACEAKYSRVEARCGAQRLFGAQQGAPGSRWRSHLARILFNQGRPLGSIDGRGTCKQQKSDAAPETGHEHCIHRFPEPLLDVRPPSARRNVKHEHFRAEKPRLVGHVFRDAHQEGFHSRIPETRQLCGRRGRAPDLPATPHQLGGQGQA